MAGRGGYLYRRTSGIYVVRICVPKRLKHVLGRGEIHVSTNLKSLSLARLAAFRLLLEWKQKILELDGMDVLKVTEGSPLLAGDGFISFKDFIDVTGLTREALLTEVSNLKLPLYCFTKGWRGIEVQDIDEVEKDFDGSFVLNSVEELGLPVVVSERMRLANTAMAVGQIQSGGCYEAWHLSREKSRKIVVFFDEAQKVGIDDLLLMKPDAEALRVRLRLGITEEMLEAAKGKLSPVVSSMPVYASQPAGKYDSWPVSRLVEKFVAAKLSDWKEDQRRKMTNICQVFVELMGDPVLADIDRELIREYMARLQTLPADLYQSKRRHGTKTLADLIKASDEAGDPKITPNTVNTYIGKLSEMMGWALREEFMTSNPASRIQMRDPEKVAIRDQDERCKFETSDLAQIFGADWFRDGKPKLPSNGRYSQYQPHYYWLPLLGLYTGARLNELSQLYLSDLTQDDAETWFIDFNLNQDDKTDEDDKIDKGDKSLKTVNAVRQIAIHSDLIKLGLIEYAKRLAEAGHTRLFPELRRSKIKGYGKAAGSWFNERYLGRRLKIVRDGTKTFHSLRHTFISALYDLDDANLTEQMINQFTGHARGETLSAIRYRKDKVATKQLVYIDRLDFDLPVIAPFNIEAGMLAVKNALDRKARHKRRADKTVNTP